MTTLIKTKQGIANNHIPLFFLLLLMAICTPINELHAQEASECKVSDVDKIAYFKGCDPELEWKEFISCSQSKMLRYIYSEVKYPPAAREEWVEGTVVIGFTIFSDGSIGNAKVLRSIGYGCDEEVLRVVESMPNWQPAILEGKPVSMDYNLPIKFKL